MENNRTMHPCFNSNARHQYGRLHLPVAPKCNIQCNFCNRKYDCVNESRPGVTSKILSPGQALKYVEKYLEINPKISTIGIAGPGDPMANPTETIETIRLIREKYPDLIFCLSTNGLQLFPYIDVLTYLGVSHVTVTVTAINPEIGARIYAWVRDGKVIYRGLEAAKLLWERQLQSIVALKKAGMIVKVNTIIIPGINDHHIGEIAERMAQLGVNVMNCMPLLSASGSQFENLTAPAATDVERIRQMAETYLPQMKHCARCRADAAGFIGQTLDEKTLTLLNESAKLPLDPEQNRPYVAVATMEGFLINQHLGEATHLHIFKMNASGAELLEIRPMPEPGNGMERWQEMRRRLADCHTILVSGIGENPSKVLKEGGIKVYETEGMIDSVLALLATGQPIMKKTTVTKCGFSCKGDGLGCG